MNEKEKNLLSDGVDMASGCIEVSSLVGVTEMSSGPMMFQSVRLLDE